MDWPLGSEAYTQGPLIQICTRAASICQPDSRWALRLAATLHQPQLQRFISEDNRHSWRRRQVLRLLSYTLSSTRTPMASASDWTAERTNAPAVAPQMSVGL